MNGNTLCKIKKAQNRGKLINFFSQKVKSLFDFVGLPFH